MGLDQVEIIMRVEESFGLTIVSADASQMRTVGDLCMHIVQQTGAKGFKACMSSVVFYRTRTALIEAASIPRREIRLETKLATLLPIRQRRLRWREIENALRLSMPPLSLSVRLHLLVLSFSLAITVLPLIWIARYLQTGSLIFLLVALPLLGYISLLRATSSLAIDFPPGDKTVRSLTKSILALNYGSLAEKLQMMDEEAVWLTVQGIVCDQMQMDPADVTYGSTWEELGID